jgi:O-antigen ligase
MHAAEAPKRQTLNTRSPVLAQVWARWWVTLVVLGLTMGSDYKVRIRDKTEAISGRPDPLILLEIGIYALVFALVVARTRTLRTARTDALTALFGCYAGYLAFSSVWSPYRSLALVRASQLVVVAMLGFVLVRYARSAHFHRLAHAHLAVVTVSVLYGKLQPAPPVSRIVAGRFTWLSIHPVTSANWTALALLFAVAYLLQRGGPARLWPAWLYGPAAVVVGYGLLASKTRGSVLGFAVGGVLCLVLGVQRARRTDLLVLGPLALVFAALTAGSTVVAYAARGENTEQLATLNSRTSLWSEAFAAVRAAPVAGHGLGASRGIFQDATGLGGAHNAFINVFVDGGAIGVVLWLAVLVGLAARLRTLRRRRPRFALETAVIAGALVLFAVDSVFMEGLGAAATLPSTWLCVLVSWAAVLSRVPGQVGARAERDLVPDPGSDGGTDGGTDGDHSGGAARA